ncbi:phosphatidylcholine/phosphatidylserine synthase [Roseivirga sp. E12]|uniref:CDP-alcohol phosphatidyltransferase family protein n=1 Tax=Roseivirga sp. E12 TaxID=2819237 RepID=UPI001ABC49B9|nr:CDP-alcohol phosphatidyltransferase family protein [Roseivirga sp. E12]MBO3700822.1 CDP-alcohol phosphatidyltransferase family protein [Roseivirga sp. E12]
MNWIRKNIPNLFTVLNLSLGVLGIHQILTGNPSVEPTIHYYIFAAAFFDLFDGLLARKLNVASEFGVQLDSLADLITFGVLPAFIYSRYVGLEGWGLLLLMVPICSAIRLAIFNTDSSQKTSFKGISTTAHGMFAGVLPIILYNQSSWFGELFSGNEIAIIILALFFSFLMVSPIKMMSFKFENFSLKSNWERMLLILASLVLIIIWQYDAAPYIIITYIILSLTSYFKGIPANSEG